LFGNKLEKDPADFRFRISVYGVLLNKGRVLLQRHPLIGKFGLPGGGIELGESIRDSLEREYKEETGILIKTIKLIDVTQDFFTYDGKCAHSILIFYEVVRIDGKLKTNDEDSAEVKYFSLSELNENNVQRIFWPIIERLKRA